MTIPFEGQIPHNFEPRDYQLPALEALDRDGFRRLVAVWHRRAGKDKVFLNYMIKEMILKKGVYFYFFPTYQQGKKVLWNGIDRDGFKFMDHIPMSIRKKTNSQEMFIELQTGSIFQIIGTDNINCYDDKTEILTEDGWKYFKDLTDEKVATRNNGFLEYERPTRYIKHEYEGEMYSIKSKAMDLLVTPNHKFYVKSRKGVWKFRKIKDISAHNDRIPSTNGWKGEDKEVFVLPEIERNSHDRSKNREQVFLMKHWCAFIGIYVSEGSVYDAGKGNYRIYITQSKGIKGGVKGDVYRKIKKLLNNMGLSYEYTGESFLIRNKQLYCYLKKLGRAREKHIPRELMGLSKKHLNEIISWMILGDGTVVKSGQRVYYSTSKRLMDDLQELVIKTGYSGSIRVKKQGESYIRGRKINGKDIYFLVIRKSKFKYFRSTKKEYISKENYKGNIYCVEVKNHIVKVRRNGMEVWSGNSVVGTNPIGSVFSEYALQDPRAWDYIRPILAENKGWAIFNYTPRGTNHGYDLYEMAKQSKYWYCERLTVEDTGAIDEESLAIEKDEIMRQHGNDALYRQEYFCSFDAPILGAYFGVQMQKADDDKPSRIGKVPHETNLQVNTAWDLGMDDATTIWFFQVYGREVRLINYYEASGEGLAHYVNHLQSLSYKLNYNYGTHYAPHDIEVREMGPGKSRKESARALGLKFKTGRKLDLMDGIESARNLISRCWFDAKKCKRGINALRNYHKDYDEKAKAFRTRPKHDWASHGADAFRELAVNLRDESRSKKRERPKKRKPRNLITGY